MENKCNKIEHLILNADFCSRPLRESTYNTKDLHWSDPLNTMGSKRTTNNNRKQNYQYIINGPL